MKASHEAQVVGFLNCIQASLRAVFQPSKAFLLLRVQAWRHQYMRFSSHNHLSYRNMILFLQSESRKRKSTSGKRDDMFVLIRWRSVVGASRITNTTDNSETLLRDSRTVHCSKANQTLSCLSGNPTTSERNAREADVFLL